MPSPSPFPTPIRTRGWISLPFNELVFWTYFTWQAGRKHPERSLAQRMGLGLLQMSVFLGSEWCHNLAHAVAAQWAGKPMDALEVVAGMPVCIYSVENHRSTRPRQHILRALGGPVFNLGLMLLSHLARHFTRPTSAAREVLDTAIHMNTFLCTGSLLPLPGIDGGPILKWSLVANGHTPAQADAVVRRVDMALSPALGGLAGAYFRRGRWVSGMAGAFLAIIALAVGMGWMKGQTQET
jgi:hypothetical protein